MLPTVVSQVLAQIVKINSKIGLLNTPVKLADVSENRKAKRYKALISKRNSPYFFVDIPMLVEGCKALIDMCLYETLLNLIKETPDH